MTDLKLPIDHKLPDLPNGMTLADVALKAAEACANEAKLHQIAADTGELPPELGPSDAYPWSIEGQRNLAQMHFAEAVALQDWAMLVQAPKASGSADGHEYSTNSYGISAVLNNILIEGMIAIRGLLEGRMGEPNPRAAHELSEAMHNLQPNPVPLKQATHALEAFKRDNPEIAKSWLQTTFAWVDSQKLPNDET